MPKVKKLPKWAIRQAGGINKKAWALARRGSRLKTTKTKTVMRSRKTGKRVGVAKTTRVTRVAKRGYGAWFKIGRTADVFSGPAQGSLVEHGLTAEAGTDALARYSGGMSAGGFDPEEAKGTYGGIGTGLVRDWFRSKLGVYRGLGQKKILSGVMAANPELLALAEQGETPNDLRAFEIARMQYDRSYEPLSNRWDVKPGAWANRFWRSVGTDVALKIGQKAAEKWLNPILPKGYNL